MRILTLLLILLPEELERYAGPFQFAVNIFIVRLFIQIFKLVSVREKHSVNIIFGNFLNIFVSDVVFLSDLFYIAYGVGTDMPLSISSRMSFGLF